jgi:hypothetical protein
MPITKFGKRVLVDVSGMAGIDSSVPEGTYVTGTIIEVNEIAGEVTISLDDGLLGLNQVVSRIALVWAEL